MIKNIERKTENAKYRLAEINSWIGNFDSKASFLLTYMGVLIGFLGTKGTPKILGQNFVNRSIVNLGLLKICTVILYLTALGALVLLILTLLARVRPREKSIDSSIFFGDIAKTDYEKYEDTILNENEEELLKDIVYQSYNNSRIATKKARYYNYSIILIIIATIMFLFTTTMGGL